MMGIYLITGIFMLIGWLVSNQLKSKFAQYSQDALDNGRSGKEVAEKMLRDNNIYDVKITSVEGQLTDHYNPLNKTVNLSPEVYSGRSVMAAAVAAHECGHAVQHANAYAMLQVRSALVPVVSFASQWVQWILLAGIFALSIFHSTTLLTIGVVMFGAVAFFSVITLPVEFDASRRALAWLDSSRMATVEEHAKAKDALWWAAMTYVVSALSAIATLLYYLMILLGARRNS